MRCTRASSHAANGIDQSPATRNSIVSPGPHDDVSHEQPVTPLTEAHLERPRLIRDAHTLAEWPSQQRAAVVEADSSAVCAVGESPYRGSFVRLANVQYAGVRSPVGRAIVGRLHRISTGGACERLCQVAKEPRQLSRMNVDVDAAHLITNRPTATRHQKSRPAGGRYLAGPIRAELAQ